MVVRWGLCDLMQISQNSVLEFIVYFCHAPALLRAHFLDSAYFVVKEGTILSHLERIPADKLVVTTNFVNFPVLGCNYCSRDVGLFGWKLTVEG